MTPSNRPMELMGPARPELARGLDWPGPQLIAIVLYGHGFR